MDWGAAFDRQPNGEVALAREAAHSVRRVLHARDTTGRTIGGTLVGPHRGARAHPCRRARARHGDPGRGRPRRRRRATWIPTATRRTARARATLLATGGAGQVFRETTNPEVASGDGIAMAWAAGARVADLEFVQFHPTALQVEGQPRFLLSEALRGEGARLVNADGEPFMTRYEDGRRPGAARSRVAGHRPRAGPHRPARVPVAAASRRDDGPRPLPAHRRGLPRRRARPGARSGAGQPGRALRDGRRRDRPRRPDLGARACSPPARSPAPASTAPTAWPATRCSRGSSSDAGPGRRWSRPRPARGRPASAHG